MPIEVLVDNLVFVLHLFLFVKGADEPGDGRLLAAFLSFPGGEARRTCD